MSIYLAREAFIFAAKGKLTLADDGLSLSYSGSAQVLKVKGWHDDSIPFAQVTAPFTGDPAERAAQLARDIIASHTGKPMPAPTPITGLAAVLKEQLTAATARASRVGEDAKQHVANLNSTLDTAEGVVNDVKRANTEIQAALGLSTNGGPALDPLPPAVPPQGQ